MRPASTSGLRLCHETSYRIEDPVSSFDRSTVDFRLLLASLLCLSVLFLDCGGIAVKEERTSISEEDSYHQAMTLYNEGRFAAAVEILERLILGDPHYAESYFLNGLCYFHLRRYDMSIDSFRKGLSLDPEYMPGHLGLGVSLYFSGDRVEAKRVIEEGLSRLVDEEERESWRMILKKQLPDLDI